MLLCKRLIVASLALVVVFGCGKDEGEPAPLTKETPTSAKITKTPIKMKQPLRADEKDDPKFALLFPASGKVAGWIKTVAARGGDGVDLAEFLPDLAGVLAPYRPESVASATYERVSGRRRETVEATRAGAREGALTTSGTCSSSSKRLFWWYQVSCS